MAWVVRLLPLDMMQVPFQAAPSLLQSNLIQSELAHCEQSLQVTTTPTLVVLSPSKSRFATHVGKFNTQELGTSLDQVIQSAPALLTTRAFLLQKL